VTNPKNREAVEASMIKARKSKFSLQRTLVLIRLDKNKEAVLACQGGFYASKNAGTRGFDFHWAGDAAGFRIAGDSQRGAAGEAESAADV
jgi:hypothetical protein